MKQTLRWLAAAIAALVLALPAGVLAEIDISQAGLTVSGTSPDGYIVETVELTDSPFYVGVQFHPEFKSRPNKPHPLFLSFVKASLELSENS